jgi:glycosyltransferase involved in cell wall biosynthesis
VDRRFALRRRTDLLLALVDLGVGLLSGYIAYNLRFGSQHVPDHYLVRYRAMTVGLAFGLVLAGRASGLYRRAALRMGESNVEAAVDAALTVGLAVFLVNEFTMNGDLSRSWVGLVTLAVLLLSLASRVLIRRCRRMLVPLGIALERYAVVGDDAAGRRLMDDLTRAPGAPFVVVDRLPADLSPEELRRRARELRVDGLILPPDTDPATAGRLAGVLSGAGIDALIAPGLLGLEMRVASIAMLHGIPLLRATGLVPTRKAVRMRAKGPTRGVAILGTRGVPANYGGFETFAERLALRFVEMGVPVTVYCRRNYATAGAQWKGIRLVTLPTISNKYLDTVVHTLLSVLHLVTRTRIRDVILCNAANACVLPLLRASRRRVVMNVDGLEWRRTKWGIAGRAWYRMGEWLSVRWAGVLVTDAHEVRTYYRVRHNADSVMIPYGADQTARGAPLADLPAKPDDYFLYVSRWERENNPLMVARAHAAAGLARSLIMLGEATYDKDLERDVRAAAASNALLPGALYGEIYRSLLSNARCYIHATEVGGTHPALIEAMGAGNLCLVLDTPENREVAGPEAWYFSAEEDLVGLLGQVDRLTARDLNRLRKASRERAAREFSWDAVARAYLGLLTTPANDNGERETRLTTRRTQREHRTKTRER